jgi:type IV secretion system protein VirB11
LRASQRSVLDVHEQRSAEKLPFAGRQNPIEGSASASARVSRLGRDHAVTQFLRPIAHFLEAPDVTELSICRPAEVCTRTLAGWIRHDIPELTAEYLQALMTALIVYNGVGQQSVAYVVLPGGQRGTIIQPPAVIAGTLSLLIRKHAPVVKTLAKLEADGAFDAFRDVSFNTPTAEACEQLVAAPDFTRLEPFEATLLALKRDGAIRQFLEHCVLYRRNIVIAGKTGSGKTTFARSLIEQVPAAERIVTIEDVHELLLPRHPNRVHMLYGSGAGRIPAEECLAACLRQSPDRIFLAELRGGEAWEYLNALNTGHPGSITTTHANSAVQTFDRIATLVKASEVGRQLDLKTIRRVLYATVDVVLFIRDRRLVEVFYDPVFARGS